MRHYAYDANGNQLYQEVETYTPKAGISRGKAAFKLDYTAGNVVAETAWMEYNGFNQMVFSYRDGKHVTYDYRPDGLRQSKRVYETGAETLRRHVWDGQGMVAEVNASGGMAGRYLRGTGLLAMVQDGARRVNVQGTVLEAYHYDAFGNQENPAALDPNPFRYCGEYFDGETGTVYLRARYYDARNGRFCAEDSVRDGVNWYAYCGNNPVLRIDPSGFKFTKASGRITDKKTGFFSGLGKFAKGVGDEITSFVGGVIAGAGEAVSMGLTDRVTESLNVVSPPNPYTYTAGKILGNIGAGIGGFITGGGAATTIAASGGASALVGAGAVAVAGGAVAVSGGAAAVKNTAALASMVVGSGGGKDGFIIKDDAAKHIFRDTEGHFIEDISENRQQLLDLVNNPNNFLGTDQHGNNWYAQTTADGQQVWASVRGNEIKNGGINQVPKLFHPNTGLSSPTIPGIK